MTTQDAGVGQPGFVARHGLLTPAAVAAAEEVAARITELDLRTVRLVVVDQHGATRAKFFSRAPVVKILYFGLARSG